MTNSKQTRSFKLSKSKLPMFLIAGLLLYLSVSFSTQLGQLAAMQDSLDDMQIEIHDLRDKNSGLYDQLEQLRSDDYIEQTAREKLGLVMPGEARIVTVPGE